MHACRFPTPYQVYRTIGDAPTFWTHSPRRFLLYHMTPHTAYRYTACTSPHVNRSGRRAPTGPFITYRAVVRVVGT